MKQKVRLVAILLIVSVFVLMLRNYVLYAHHIRTRSPNMEPTLDALTTYRYSPTGKKNQPARFDIVVYKLDNELYVGRVIALSGELFSITDAVVSINKKVLDEPYIRPATITPSSLDSEEIMVAEDTIIVMYDNRGLLGGYYRNIPARDIVGIINEPNVLK